MKNKKALEMAISTLVVLILGLVVLALAAVVLTMGWNNFSQSLGNLFGTSSISSAVESCNLACQNNVKYDFCCSEKKVKISENKETITCQDKRLEVSCSKFKCEENYCSQLQNTN